MAYRILRGTRFDLRPRILIFSPYLLAFILLIILIQLTTIWPEMLSRLSLTREYATESRGFEECEQFTFKEKINWDYLYYYEDQSQNKSLIWCKIPKVGSTTLVKLFLRLAGKETSGNSAQMHVVLRKVYPEPSPEQLNTTFKFVVVRHPFERILSAYRDKLENYSIRDPGFSIYGKRMVKRLVENGTAVYPTFPEFVTYLLESSPEGYQEHWRPMSILCTPCSIHYDAIVKLENFDLEIKAPLRQAGIYEDIGRSNSVGTTRNEADRYFQQLSFAQVQNLYEIYRKDFLLFGYTPDEYFAMVPPETAKEDSKLAMT